MEAHRLQVIQEQETMSVVSLMHEKAFQQAENSRKAAEAANQRKMEEAMAKVQAQEL